jgi:hypothetical protein
MRSVRPKLVVALAGLAVFALSGSPAAAEPFAFAQAERGSLRVVSGAFITTRDADLRGVWINEPLGCEQFRSLRVAVLVDRVRAGRTTRVRRERTGPVRNCAEGGPNFGFTLRASRIGMGCPNGTWRPGLYTFVVRTTHIATQTRAVLSLSIQDSTGC